MGLRIDSALIEVIEPSDKLISTEAP